jgi:hypothetical protein
VEPPSEAEAPFSTTLQIERSPDAIVVDSGDPVTVTYTITGTGTTTAFLVRPDGSAPVALTCDGAEHEVEFSPVLSQVYFIAAEDDNGPLLDRLEVACRHTLTASDPTASATITTQRSGLWTDTNPATSPWPDGTLPGVNDIVSCSHTVKVNARLDGGDAILQCARFLNQSGGTLKIHNDDGTTAVLWLTDYVGAAGSELDIDSTHDETKSCLLILRNRPFHANDTSGNSPDDYANYWNAVDIRGGDLRMRGKTITPFVRAAGDIAQGATYIDLQEPVTGWEPSYILILPDSRGAKDTEDTSDHTDMVLVRGVGPDGSDNPNRRVHLVRPTRWAHPAPTDVDDSPAVRTWDGVTLAPHVICLSKTATILSEDPTGIGSLGGQPRAHMFLGGGGRVDCRDAMVSHGMGRATLASTNAVWDQNPGYNAQYHRLFPIVTFDLHGPVGGLGYDADVDEPEFEPENAANVHDLDGPSHRFVNCLAADPFENNTALTPDADNLASIDLPLSIGVDCANDCAMGGWVHFHTHYGLYKGSVGFNFFGTCWGFADGTSTRNVIVGNLVCRTDGRGNRLDVNNFLSQGSGWLLGSYDQCFRGNISAGAGGLYNRLDQYAFGAINVPSINGNFDPPNPLHWTAWQPDFQGASTLDAGERTELDNAESAIWEWRDNEGYGGGAGRHIVFYTVGTRGSLGPPITVFTTQTMYRQTAWGFFHQGSFPYGTYRLNREQWFVRGDYSNPRPFDVNTDYLQCEVTYKDWDCEGVSTLVALSAQSGQQQDDDPNPGAVGRLMISGGRYVVDQLVTAQLGEGSGLAAAFYGHHVIVGGDRTTGSAGDAVTVEHPDGVSDPVVFYMSFRDVSELDNFEYNVGQNLCSPKRYELNRWNGHDYDAYPWVQDPAAILPQSSTGGTPPSDPAPTLATAHTWGCPEDAMTNQDCHDKYEPLPDEIADVTEGLYQGTTKAGWPDDETPGLCWGGRLTPATAAAVSWIDGVLGAASGKADEV